MLQLVETSKHDLKQNWYFLSDKIFNGKILYPRIPNNNSTRRGEEENTRERICVAPSIKKCLRALPQDRVKTGSEFYVYKPIGNYRVYAPTALEVADSVVTDEHWILDPVKVKCLGRIRLVDKYNSGEIFSHKGEDFVVYDWDYEFVI